MNSLRKQLEFYFGDKNYPKDQFMHDNADSDGFLSCELLTTFNRIKALTKEKEKLVEAIQNSKIVEVSECQQKMRRRPEE